MISSQLVLCSFPSQFLETAAFVSLHETPSFLHEVPRPTGGVLAPPFTSAVFYR